MGPSCYYASGRPIRNAPSPFDSPPRVSARSPKTSKNVQGIRPGSGLFAVRPDRAGRAPEFLARRGRCEARSASETEEKYLRTWRSGPAFVPPNRASGPRVSSADGRGRIGIAPGFPQLDHFETGLVKTQPGRGFIIGGENRSRATRAVIGHAVRHRREADAQKTRQGIARAQRNRSRSAPGHKPASSKSAATGAARRDAPFAPAGASPDG